MRMSQEGVDFIKRREGYRARPYMDSAGFPTVGYGHLILCSESFSELTKEEAEDLLYKDLAPKEQAVQRLVTVDLNQHQFDALVSLCFNIGEGNFSRSTLLKVLNLGMYEAVPTEIAKWKKSGGKVVEGLKNRRALEIKIWEKGIYE